MTNIVLLTVDSLRADHCSCYGYERETTPNLDRFASDGVRFENAYSASSHTREAVPALLTGQYPHAAVDENYHLAEATLATLLKESHHTGAFHSNPFLSRAYGYDRDFDEFDDDLYLSKHKLVALAQRFWDKIRGHHYARAETINERSLAWLDSLPDNEPFVLWNHYMDVHGPYEPPEPYRSEWTDESVSDSDAQDLYSRTFDDPESIDSREQQLLVDLYDGEIRYTDAKVGALLDALRARSLLEETVVVITSDHGDGFGENGQYGHPRQLSDELVSVPLLLGGRGARSTALDTPVSALDVVPTLLTATGHTVEHLPGLPFQKVLKDDEDSRERCVVLEARGEDEESNRRRYAVYDRTDTVHYERNRSATTEQPGGDGKLFEVLRHHLNGEREATESHSEQSVESDTVDERLDALGYK